MPAKSAWLSFSGAPGAFIGVFGLRASKVEDKRVGRLRVWSVCAKSISLGSQQRSLGRAGVQQGSVGAKGTAGCWKWGAGAHQHHSQGSHRSRCHLPSGCTVGAVPCFSWNPSSPVSCLPSGLAVMMQLARELKMLAKEFSLAVVVSVAAP